MGALKLVRNVALSIALLLVLAVGGGLAYTYYFGPDGTQTNQAIQEPVETQPKQQLPKPAAQDPKAPVSASVAVLTSPAAPGSNAMLSVRTSPLAKCSVVVEYAGVAVKDSGLAPKAADEFGNVSWTWTIVPAAPAGKWPVKVTCAKAAKSAFVQAEQVIE